MTTERKPCLFWMNDDGWLSLVGGRLVGTVHKECIEEVREALAAWNTRASPSSDGPEPVALTYGQKLIAEAIEAHFGERVEEYDEDVDDTSNHDAWEAFDTAFVFTHPVPADGPADDSGQQSTWFVNGCLVDRHGTPIETNRSDRVIEPADGPAGEAEHSPLREYSTEELAEEIEWRKAFRPDSESAAEQRGIAKAGEADDLIERLKKRLHRTILGTGVSGRDKLINRYEKERAEAASCLAALQAALDDAQAERDALIDQRNVIVPRLEADDQRVAELTEWKGAIIDLCRAIGSDDMQWGGDKTGWGFIHYFVKHLHTRALAGEQRVAEIIRAFTQGILHGDDDHREWLLSAAAAFIAGLPLPPPNGLGRAAAAEQRVAELTRERDEALQMIHTLAELGKRRVDKEHENDW